MVLSGTWYATSGEDFVPAKTVPERPARSCGVSLRRRILVAPSTHSHASSSRNIDFTMLNLEMSTALSRRTPSPMASRSIGSPGGVEKLAAVRANDRKRYAATAMGKMEAIAS